MKATSLPAPPELDLVVQLLRRKHGAPELPPAKGAFEYVFWENAVYLLPDERRREVFLGLRDRVGLTAQEIGAADSAVLLELARRGGMRPETRVFRWREIARIAMLEFGGDLNGAIAKLPWDKAARALRHFPNIGEPGAQKILIFTGVACPNGLPLESNGLRVLNRLGYGRAQKSYGAAYKSTQEAIAHCLPGTAAKQRTAHQLLRLHGQTMCRTNDPNCAACPLATAGCHYAMRLSVSGSGSPP